MIIIIFYLILIILLLTLENRTLNRLKNCYREHYFSADNKNLRLEQQLNELIQENISLKIKVKFSGLTTGMQKDMPAEVKETVKYAMIKSHPDNGGKQEDFIKFKKCYENICKGGMTY